MLADRLTTARIAVFAELIGLGGTRVGRTALMKMCYFLQILKDVPLGYEFSLYSYGPFDSEVLGDLRTAEDLSAIDSSVVSFPGGYQYILSTSSSAAQVKREAKQFLSQYIGCIKWVADTFANRSASELELLSTIVYVDRNVDVKTFESLREKVKLIKPHFSLDEISKKIEWLEQKELLTLHDPSQMSQV